MPLAQSPGVELDELSVQMLSLLEQVSPLQQAPMPDEQSSPAPRQDTQLPLHDWLQHSKPAEQGEPQYA
jgi:hypothetical protein